jgi:hypothetical protein
VGFSKRAGYRNARPLKICPISNHAFFLARLIFLSQAPAKKSKKSKKSKKYIKTVEQQQEVRLPLKLVFGGTHQMSICSLPPRCGFHPMIVSMLAKVITLNTLLNYT